MSEATPVENRGAITVSLMLAGVMSALDSTIANVALPHIQGAISAGADEIVWVLTSYIVASAIMTPLSGWLSNRVGMKRVLLLAIGGFTAASMACGSAQTLPELIACRFAQGACGAFIMPLSQAVMLNINPPSRHARAMSIWAMGAVMGPVLGPVIGGYITDVSSWRWCFFVNLPVGVLAFLGVWTFMPADGAPRERRFDFLGFASLVVAVAALELMLDRGPGEDWFSSREIWAETLVTVTALWIFLVHTATTKTPFIDGAIFRDPNFGAACIYVFIVQAVVFGTLAILPLITQSLMHFPVLLSGLVTAPRGIGMMAAMWTAPVLTARFGPRPVLIVGSLGAAYALWRMTQYDLSMTTTPLLTAGLVQGFSQGLMMVPITTLGFATLRPQDRADGAALQNLLRSVGSASGVAILQGLAVMNTQTVHASLAAQAAPTDPMFRWAIDRAFSPETSAGAEALNAEITRQASMIAYLDDYRLMFILSLCCLPLVLLLRSPRRPRAADAKRGDIEAAVVE